MSGSKFGIFSHISIVIFASFALSTQNSWAGKDKHQANKYEKRTGSPGHKIKTFKSWINKKLMKKTGLETKTQSLPDVLAGSDSAIGSLPDYFDQDFGSHYGYTTFKPKTNIHASWDGIVSDLTDESYLDAEHSHKNEAFRENANESRSMEDLVSASPPIRPAIRRSLSYNPNPGMMVHDFNSSMQKTTLSLNDFSLDPDIIQTTQGSVFFMQEQIIPISYSAGDPPPLPYFAEQEIHLRFHLIKLEKIKEVQRELIDNIHCTPVYKPHESNLSTLQRLFSDEFNRVSIDDRLLIMNDDDLISHHSFVIAILVLWIDSFQKILKATDLSEEFNNVCNLLHQLNTLWRSSFEAMVKQIAILCNLESGQGIDFFTVLENAKPLLPANHHIDVTLYTKERTVILEALLNHIATKGQDVYAFTDEGIHFMLAIDV